MNDECMITYNDPKKNLEILFLGQIPKQLCSNCEIIFGGSV